MRLLVCGGASAPDPYVRPGRVRSAGWGGRGFPRDAFRGVARDRETQWHSVGRHTHARSPLQPSLERENSVLTVFYASQHGLMLVVSGSKSAFARSASPAAPNPACSPSRFWRTPDPDRSGRCRSDSRPGPAEFEQHGNSTSLPAAHANLKPDTLSDLSLRYVRPRLPSRA